MLRAPSGWNLHNKLPWMATPWCQDTCDTCSLASLPFSTGLFCPFARAFAEAFPFARAFAGALPSLFPFARAFAEAFLPLRFPFARALAAALSPFPFPKTFAEALLLLPFPFARVLQEPSLLQGLLLAQWYHIPMPFARPGSYVLVPSLLLMKGFGLEEELPALSVQKTRGTP